MVCKLKPEYSVVWTKQIKKSGGLLHGKDSTVVPTIVLYLLAEYGSSSFLSFVGECVVCSYL